MYIKSLKLKNFRSYSDKEFEFRKGINILIGENGVGKTNVIEAIYYLSLARSFKGVDDIDLIKKGNESSYIESKIQIGDLNKKINILILKNGRQIILNNKPLDKISDLSKSVNVILFEPKNVMLFRGSPKERRDFLNISLSKQNDEYLDAMSNFNKILRERNEILKAEKIDKILLETTTELLIKTSAIIVGYRQVYLKDINDILIKITRTLTGAHENIVIKYQPFVEYNSEFESNAKLVYQKALENDLKQKTTTIGIHREDFSVDYNGKDIATFGSQGENRIVAIALKLAPYFLIEDKDKRPIVVLDDVMSELDENHQRSLIKFLKKFEQVFITATKLVIVGASHYEIKNN